MQKIYQRINWENDPSTNTPINEDNLNKMDYAIDTLDSRVVLLYGYQDRVAQSEKNAKTSETNAKESETNAKQSEIKAKEYMESAFNASQEGYEALVEKVERMDIKTSNEFELRDTKNGGYRLLEMSGATVQNGEPSPSNPIAIENVGDCVDLISAYRNVSDGATVSSVNYATSKRNIPCKAGDIVKIVCENAKSSITALFYNSNTYVTSASKYDSSYSEVTIPSGVDNFAFYVSGNINEVGKITLTVNGKYVVQVVEKNKNLFDERRLALIDAWKFDGEWYTGTVQKLSNNNGINLKEFKENTRYTLSCVCKSNSLSSNVRLDIYYTDGTKSEWWIGNSTTGATRKFITKEGATVSNIVTNYSSNDTIYLKNFIIQEGAIENPTYEPYTEKVATIFLDEPLRDGDRLVKIDGVCNQNHKRSIIDLSSFTWVLVENRYWRTVAPTGVMKTYGNNTSANAFTEKYMLAPSNDVMNNKAQNSIGLASNTNLVVESQALYIYCNNGSTTEKPSGIMEYELMTPTLTPLDTESQLALNGLVTFKDMTYLEVDSKIKSSGIKGEYGTSQVGAYTLKSLLNSESNAVKIEDAINTMLLITP